MAFFIWLLLLLSLSKFNSIPSFLFLNHLVSFKIQNFHSSIFCDIILCNDFSKFVVTEDSLQDKLETICMTANTVVNQSVFHFFKTFFYPHTTSPSLHQLTCAMFAATHRSKRSGC